jgi:hypothetical protein
MKRRGGAKRVVDDDRSAAARNQVIAARKDLRNIGSDLVERATQDNLTGRRQSHRLGPDHTGTGQLAASSRENDNHDKNQS